MTNRIIIDTREPIEYAQSHVEGAINIPPAEFMKNELPSDLKNIQKDAEIIVYCRSGQRSNTCSMILREHGFNNLVNGINEHHVSKIMRQ